MCRHRKTAGREELGLRWVYVLVSQFTTQVQQAHCWLDHNIINYSFILNKNKPKPHKTLSHILSCIMGSVRQSNCTWDEGVGVELR